MKSVCPLHAHSLAKNLAFTALFAALCCVASIVLIVPLPNGYFNLGDTFVLLGAWFIGPLYGSVAAALGSALADLLCGFSVYAPATFCIKGLDAFATYTVYFFLKKLIKKERLDFLPRVLSVCAGEGVMLAGYFLFERILYGFGGALASLTGNALQGGCCLLLAVAILAALYPVRAAKKRHNE